jgi:hypothetical protein
MDIEPVAPRFFQTWGVRLLRGRDFTAFDQHVPTSVNPNDAGGGRFFAYGDAAARVSRVAIVNETFARKFFGQGDPIGQELGIGQCPGDRKVIVGVVADHLDRQRVAITPMVYVPFPSPGTTPFATFAARATGDSQRLVAPLRRLMADTRAQVDGDVMTGLAYREREWRRERMLSGFLVFFGVLALGISCLGVYGILGYIVSLRTPELGIRMALGAQRFAVIRMVVAESVAPVALGMGIGLTTALMLTRWVESILFGVSTQDPWTIAGAAALLLLTAAAAAFVPARRAALTDPMAALRYE